MAPSIPSQDAVVHDVPIRNKSEQPVDRVTDHLETPSLDDRSYRVVRLSNQLECLLVHDPETDKASAALDVNVGNFSDEADMPGMAHAVEHLLFMGTKKYPVENAYNQYLSAHSGHSNAYTGATSTNYFFEVGAKPSEGEETSESPLYGALDRFAQFFIEPLFLSSTLDRELQAVDSENKKNLQSDQWRLHQLEKSLSNPKHPYCHFSTGNFEVLKTEPEARGIDVRAKFMEFHGKHYSANRMKLCVLGREPLDVLERWSAELFSAVPNKNLPQNRWEDEVPFAKDQLKWQCFAKPVMDSRELNLFFPFMDEEKLYESQPSRYISHLIGHEGPGSVFSYIKSKGWANSLSAGVYAICPGTPGVFDCQVRLTKDGLMNYKEIVKVFFQYVALLRETPPQEWIFEEQKGMADVDFKFKQKTPASRFTSKIAAVMQKPLPREWLLSGQSRLRKFDADLIAKGLDCLRPDNFRMTLVSRDYPGDWDQKEKWYGTEYKAEKIPEEFLAEIAKAADADAKTRLPQLHLPHKNQFIPTKLEVEKKEVKEPSLVPRLLRNDNIARTWFKKDDTFWVPKANLVVSCKNPIIFATAENSVKAKLYTDLVRDALEEYSYDADLAGLQYNVTLDSRGMFVEVSGYNDKLPVLLEQVLITMRDLEIRDERFDIVKERLSRGYKNWELQQPFTQIGDYISWLTSEHDFVVDQLEAELPGITVEATRAFHKQLISQMHIEAYVHGNLYKEDALKLTTMIENTLKPRVLPKDQLPILRSLLFPAGANFLYKKTLKDPANVNHCIEYYLHIGSKGDRMVRAKTQLLDQMIHEPAFDQLRTKEQLGYVVFSGLRGCSTTYGFRFIIQSERTSEYLESRIDSFLNAQATALNDMSDSEFESHKRAVVVKRLEKVKNLDQETGRHWAQIANEYYDFEAAQEDAAHVKRLTKSDMIDFYSCHILPSSPTRAKLVVYLEAQGTSTKTQEAASSEKEPEVVPNNGTVPYLIEDVREYKSRLVASSGARPIRELVEFEDFDAKLYVAKVHYKSGSHGVTVAVQGSFLKNTHYIQEKSELRSQLAAKTSSSKKRKISNRQLARGDILEIRHSSPDIPIQSCETEIDPDPSLSFASTTPIPPTGSRSPAYIRNDSVPPASSLPAHLQTNYSDYASSAASSPSGAYADLSINSDRGGDSPLGAEPNSGGVTGHLDPRGSSPFAVKPSHHRAIMGGAADYSDRGSSPLKRRASSMDPDADPTRTAGDQDVEMAQADTQNEPEESSSPQAPAQQDKNMTTDASPSVGEANGSQEPAVPSITMTEAPQPPQSIEGHIKSIRAFCEEMAMRPLEAGEQGYIVSKKWVTSVIGDERHAKHGDVAAMDASNVGPVDNSDIIWETIEDPTVGKTADVMKRFFVRLKPGLSITDHFEIFPSAAWELVKQWPGLAPGQLPIVRTARNTSDNEFQSNIQFEVHPPVFTIHRLWSDCSPKPVNQVLKAEPKPPPVKLARSSTCTWRAFLAQAKNVTDIPLKDRVQVWSIPRKLAAGAPDATSAPTPPASPSNIADPQNPQDSWTALLVSVTQLMELEDPSDRVKVDFRDVTTDPNYNGHMDLAKLGLSSDQTVVLDEHIEGTWYTYNYSPTIASAPAKSTVARSSSTSFAVNRNARSGRTSPAPTAGPVTRGRAQKSGRTIGCTGLSNLGNTCYMNSALQCIRSVEELTKYFLSREWEKEINRDNVLAHNGDVAAAYAHLLHDIYKEPPPNSVTPRQFKNTVGRYAPAFSGYGQQDSQEFIGFLLDGLQEDLSRIKKKPYIEKPDSTDEMVNDPAAIREMAEKVWDITKKRDDSVIADLFTGLYKSTLVCPECQKVSITFDPFNNLTLPLPIENKWSHTVRYFPLNDRPIDIRVELNKTDSIQMLKKYVSDRTGVPPERLHGAEEWKGKFYKQYANGAGVADEIGQSDNAWVFELEAPPTNWNSVESQQLEGSTKGRRSMIEEAESPGSKVLERMLVPVIHRRPYASRTSYGYHKWSFACVPHFIMVTPEEARNEDIIRRKILQKVATFSDNSIFSATPEEVDTSDNTEPEMVTLNGTEVDSSIGTKPQASKVQVTAQSVEGEDDMVDVTMQDAGTAAAETPSGYRFNTVPPAWVDIEKYLQPELQNMFELSYWTEGGQLLANGMQAVTEDKDYPKLSSRVVDLNPEDAPDNATNGTASNEDSSSDELSRPTLSNHQTRMAEESEEEDDSPVVKVAHRPKPVTKGPGGRKKIKPRQYGKGGKGGKAGKKRMREQAHWKEKQIQQEAEVEPQTPPEMPDSEAEAGALIRLREGIVVDWSEDAYTALFVDSQSTWDQSVEMPDAALDRAIAARIRRRKHGITLDNCLDEFERQEILSENDMWYCPRCKKHQRATKKLDLWKTPDILVVHLKRFSSSGYRRDKLDVFVDFPLEGLDLTRRVENLEDGKDEIYDLIGVDDHWGGLGGGHYTARARNFVDNQWYSYNDSSVSRTSPDKIVESSAYLLFYRRRSDQALGGPRFKEIIENLDHPAAGEEMDEAGEGQRLGEGSSQTGSPSAFQEQEAAVIPQHRLGTGGNGGLVNGTQSDDDLPSLSKINFNSQGVQPSIEDEGIDVADKPTHTSLTSDWNFDSLLNVESMKPGNDSGVPGSPAGSIATNEAQRDSSGDEQLHSSRNTFSPETDMDIPGASHYELGPSTEGEPPAYIELPPPDSRAELDRDDINRIWDDKQNVLNVPAPGDQHSEDAAEIHLDEDDRNKMD